MKKKKRIPKSEMLRILVTGDRDWRDGESIKRVLKRYKPQQVEFIVEGGQVTYSRHGNPIGGVDWLARRAAVDLGLQVIEVPANWRRYDKAAGPIRNALMLKMFKPNLVLAFHPDLAESKGTAHMVKIATKAQIPVEVFKR